MELRVLNQTEEKVELLVNAGFYGEFGSGAIDPDFAKIEFSREEVIEFRKVISQMDKSKWRAFQRSDDRVQWISDPEAIRLEDTKEENWDTDVYAEDGVLSLWKPGAIVFNAYAKHPYTTFFASTIELKKLEELFGIAIDATDKKEVATKILADQDMDSALIAEAEKRLNPQLALYGKSVSIYETEETYEDTDEDDALYGAPMYEAVITDDVTEITDTTTGRYCDLQSVIDEISVLVGEYVAKQKGISEIDYERLILSLQAVRDFVEPTSQLGGDMAIVDQILTMLASNSYTIYLEDFKDKDYERELLGVPDDTNEVELTYIIKRIA